MPRMCAFATVACKLLTALLLYHLIPSATGRKCGRYDGCDTSYTTGTKLESCSNLPSDCTSLWIAGANYVDEVAPGAFNGLSNLSSLTLGDGYIETIHSNTFQGLSNLETLDLGSNKITTLEAGAFEGLSKLVSLQLGDNQIGTIKKGAFRGLSKLISLDFSDSWGGDNPITHIEQGAFEGLSSLPNLYLSLQIATIEPGAFQGLNNLTHLSMHAISISTIQQGTFQGLGNLSSLDFHGTGYNGIPISRIEQRGFEGLSSLPALDLSACQIATIEAGAFEGLYNLTTLNLADNQLTTIPQGAFQGLANLTSLDLRYNPIEAIEQEAFVGLSSLPILDLSNHQITTIVGGAFEGLSNLRSLDLNGNEITTIEPGAFAGLSSLPTLDVSKQKLTAIRQGTFIGLSSLATLDLSDNQIGVIEQGAFQGLSALTSLDLTSANSSGLNPTIATIEPGAFGGLSSLLTLDLSNHRITTIEADAFEGLSSLTSLDLSDNPIANVEERSFHGLAQLSSLKLSRCKLPAVPSVALSALSTLKNLTLGFQAISTIPQGAFHGLSALESLTLGYSEISIQTGAFDGLAKVRDMVFQDAKLFLSAGAFRGLSSLDDESWWDTDIMYAEDGAFDVQHLTSLTKMSVFGTGRESPPCLNLTIFSSEFSTVSSAELPTILRELPKIINFPACTDCPFDGLATGEVIGNTMCLAASRGTVANAGGVQNCPPGTFNDDVRQSGSLDEVCKKCPTGSYNPQPGQTSLACLFCPAGTQQPNTGAASAGQCEECPPGTFGAVPGLPDCTRCRRGSFSSSNGSISCAQCPLGWYGTREGATSQEQGCARCPPGSTTASEGTSSVSGCIAGSSVTCPVGQFVTLNETCAPVECGAGLVLSGSVCVGCPAGTVGEPGSCSACEANSVCPGAMAVALPRSESLLDESTAPSQQAQQQSAAAERVPEPQSSLLQQAVLFVVVVAVAIALPIFIIGGGRLNDRAAQLLKSLDQFALDHKTEDGDSVVHRKTMMGAGFTLSLIVVLLALVISQLISYGENNAVANTVFAPSAGTVVNIGNVQSDVRFVASIAMPRDSSTSSFDACPNADSTVSVEDPVVHAWAIRPTSSHSGPSPDTITCTFVVDCSACSLAVTEVTTISLSLPYDAQSMAWTLKTHRAYTTVMPNTPKYSVESGHASGSSEGAIQSAAWTVSAIREVLHDTRSNTYKYGYILAVNKQESESADAARASAGFVPEKSRTTMAVSIDVGVSASETVVVAQMTVITLLGALGGLFGGVTGLYRSLFPKAESLQQQEWAKSLCKSEQTSERAVVKTGAGAGDRKGQIVNPMRVEKKTLQGP